jgi:signal transduction histidine kinase
VITDRLQLVLEASRVFLDAGVELHSVLGEVARYVSKVIGDGCAVRLFTEDRSALITTEFHHPNPEARAMAEPFLAAGPVKINPPLAELIASGKSLLVPHLEKEEQLRDTQPEVHPYVHRFGISSVLLAPLRIPGRVIGYLGAYRDDGGAPYTEEDLAFLQDLADRAAMAIENARLYTEAQHAIHARDEFISIASHELRTPLTTLQLQIEGALRAMETSSDAEPKALRKLKSAQLQVTRLSKLIDHLLDVARIGSGKDVLEIEQLDVSTIIRDVVQRFDHELERTGSTVVVRFEGGLMGYWDRLRLDQIVTNLLSNAIKYGERRPISISAAGDQSIVTIEVADRGIGIAPENLGRLFSRFERFVSSRSYGGLGLGLWITRELVKQLGGTIEADSELGRGTVFRVKLPRGAQRGASI